MLYKISKGTSEENGYFFFWRGGYHHFRTPKNQRRNREHILGEPTFGQWLNARVLRKLFLEVADSSPIHVKWPTTLPAQLYCGSFLLPLSLSFKNAKQFIHGKKKLLCSTTPRVRRSNIASCKAGDVCPWFKLWIKKNTCGRSWVYGTWELSFPAIPILGACCSIHSTIYQFSS